MKKKIDWGKIGNAAKGACETVFTCVGMVVLAAAETQSTGYSEAVKAVVNSDMSSWYMDDILKVLKRNETSDYYNAVISIVKNDDISDWSKEDMIKRISK